MRWTPLKHFCDGPAQYGLNVAADSYAVEGVRLVRTTDIHDDGTLKPSDSGVFVDPEIVEPRYRLATGDLLFSRAGSLGRCYRVPSTPDPITFAGYLVRFRPSGENDPRYLEYCAAAKFFQAAVEADAITSTISNFNAERYANVRMPARSSTEQRAIADFLDTETARIDALIAKKRRMIDLLRERHRAFVDCETRSDRYVPLRRVADLLPGFMFASDDFDPYFEGERLLRGVNIGVGVLRWDDEVRLRPGAHAPERYRLREHDVVLGMDRPFISGGTRVAMVDSRSAGALLVQRVCRVRAPSPALATIVANLLGSRRFIAHVEPDLTGVSVPHLSDSQIGAFPVPLLAVPEIEAIATRLSEAFAQLDTTTACLDAQVRLLREHRQALITAGVTGELEVPGVAA